MLGRAWPGWPSPVAADLAASTRVVDRGGRIGRLVPAVGAGFALQTLTGALTYLLPVVLGRGAHGNRRLSRLLGLGWPLRVTAVNFGVLLLVAWPASGWVPTMGWWLAGLGLGTFVPLAAVALIARSHRVEEAA
jgi:nitrite reductase (NO-forming)